MPLAASPKGWFARDGPDPASRPRALLDNHQDSEVVTSPLRPQILLANLEASGALSRRLSSRGYFALIGRLTDLIDSAVIARSGIVGKHAGDGGSALFLVLDFDLPVERPSAGSRSIQLSSSPSSILVGLSAAVRGAAVASWIPRS